MVYFRLYASNGSTLVYTFPAVNQANYPFSSKSIIEHTNPRGAGSIIISGGTAPWNLVLKGSIQSTDYDDMITKLNAMEAIALNTPYVLKIVSGSTVNYSYNVKRISEIVYDPASLKNDFSDYEITLRVNAW
jgi:hypothetical protein